MQDNLTSFTIESLLGSLSNKQTREYDHSREYLSYITNMWHGNEVVTVKKMRSLFTLRSECNNVADISLFILL